MRKYRLLMKTRMFGNDVKKTLTFAQIFNFITFYKKNLTCGNYTTRQKWLKRVISLRKKLISAFRYASPWLSKNKQLFPTLHSTKSGCKFKMLTNRSGSHLLFFFNVWGWWVYSLGFFQCFYIFKVGYVECMTLKTYLEELESTSPRV